jgi:hypothetical protein
MLWLWMHHKHAFNGTGGHLTKHFEFMVVPGNAVDYISSNMKQDAPYVRHQHLPRPDAPKTL